VLALAAALLVLPASGRVLCQERDGRIAVEAGLGAVCCDMLPDRGRVGDALVPADGCAGCVDTALDLAATHPRHPSDGCPSCTAITVAEPAGPVLHGCADRHPSGSPDQSVAGPRLRMLRSVVLLT